MKPNSVLGAVALVFSFGCDGEPTVEPTATSRKLWCQGQQVDPEMLKLLPPTEEEVFPKTHDCSWGDAPPTPDSAEATTSLESTAEYKVPVATEVGDGSLVMQFTVDVAGTLVPVRYTIDPNTRTHPDYIEASERSLAAGEILNASSPEDPNHAQAVANKIEALATVRLVMRDLGDLDSSLGVALLILGILTQYSDHLSAVNPDQTSLVATFPDAGTGYCVEITSKISDQITSVRIQGDCAAAELTHFLIVETLADKGKWIETDYCVSIAQVREGVGSYRLLAECLRDKHQSH